MKTIKKNIKRGKIFLNKANSIKNSKIERLCN